MNSSHTHATGALPLGDPDASGQELPVHGAPWLMGISVTHGKALSLRFRPRLMEWLYLLPMPVLSAAALCVFVSKGIDAGKLGPTIAMAAFVGISALAVTAAASSLFIRCWCEIEVRKGGAVTRRRLATKADQPISSGLQGLDVIHFRTGGRHSVGVCAIMGKSGGGWIEILRFSSTSGAAQLYRVLHPLIKDSGLWVEKGAEP